MDLKHLTSFWNHLVSLRTGGQTDKKHTNFYDCLDESSAQIDSGMQLSNLSGLSHIKIEKWALSNMQWQKY